MMGFGMIGCVFSVTVISMLNKIISRVNQYIPHKASMREGGAICLELIKAEAKRYGQYQRDEYTLTMISP